MKQLLEAAIALALIGSAAVPAAAQHAGGFSPLQVGKVDRLLQLVQKRLDLAPGIAELRWRTMARIEDSPSEHAMLEQVRSRSAKIGLDEKFAVRFTEAQIEAAKIIQTARHRQWAADSAGAPTRDKNADAFKSSASEPEVGSDMLTAARDAMTVLRRRGGRALLDARAADFIRTGGPDLLAAQAALKPLYEIAN